MERSSASRELQRLFLPRCRSAFPGILGVGGGGNETWRGWDDWSPHKSAEGLARKSGWTNPITRSRDLEIAWRVYSWKSVRYSQESLEQPATANSRIAIFSCFEGLWRWWPTVPFQTGCVFTPYMWIGLMKRVASCKNAGGQLLLHSLTSLIYTSASM